MKKRILTGLFAFSVLASTLAVLPASKASAWTSWYDSWSDSKTIIATSAGSTTCSYGGANMGVKPDGVYGAYMTLNQCANLIGVPVNSVTMRSSYRLVKAGQPNFTAYPEILFNGSYADRNATYFGDWDAYQSGEISNLAAICDDLISSCSFPFEYKL